MMHLKDLLPTLQLAIGPVILISGIGLLLLSMTNRLGRTVDRSRALARECRGASAADRERAIGQLMILMHRARTMRAAIACAAISILCAAILIIVLFLGALFDLAITAPFVGTMFIACLLCVIASLSFFISDVNGSLRALKVEVEASAGIAP